MKRSSKVASVLLLASLLLIAGYEGYVIGQGSTRNLYTDDWTSSADYVIKTDGVNVWAVRSDGKIPDGYIGTDLGTLLNTVIGSRLHFAERKILPALTVIVMFGNYTVTQKILINRAHLNLEFSHSFLYSALNTILEIDGHEFVWDTDEPMLNGLDIEHVTFIHTGSITANPFVYIHEPYASPNAFGNSTYNKLGGGVYFKDWHIQGQQSMNVDYVGLRITAILGCDFVALTTDGFGTGIKYDFTYPWQSSQNRFDAVQVRQCEYGVWISENLQTDVWTDLTIVNTYRIGLFINGNAPINPTFINLVVSSFYGIGVYSNGQSVTFINPMVTACYGNGSGGEPQYCFFLEHYEENGQMKVSFVNPWLSDALYGFVIGKPTYFLGAPLVLNVTYPMALDAGNFTYAKIYGIEAHGSGLYSDNAWISYGFNYALMPSTITLTPHTNVAVWVNDRNATHFQVGIASGTATIDWKVEM